MILWRIDGELRLEKTKGTNGTNGTDVNLRLEKTTNHMSPELLTIELNELTERVTKLEHQIDDLKTITFEALEMRLRWLEQQAEKAQTEPSV